MGKQPDPVPSLLTRLRKIEEWMRRRDSASPFFGTGVHPNGDNGLDLDGTLNVDGEIVARSGVARSGNFVADSAGWKLNANGTPEFNDLKLRGGIIGNDALTSPVATAVAHADASDFTLAPGTSVAKATATVVVPSGYTRAMVTATAAVSAFNPNTSYDYLFCVAQIQDDTTRGWELPVTVNPSESGIAMHTATALLTGLSGSFTVKVACSTSSLNWSTSVSGNVANIDASVVFLR